MGQIVYFIECGPKIKIGTTTNLKARIVALRSQQRAPVKLIAAIDGGRQIELALHKSLRQHSLGNEWFKDCRDTRAAIQNCLNNFPAADPDLAPPPNRRNFGRVAKALWPKNTAANLAAAAGCGVRAAEYYLAGEREPSTGAVLAVITEMLT